MDGTNGGSQYSIYHSPASRYETSSIVILVFNRIDNEGNLISDSNERIRNAKVCCALTKEYGLYFAPKNSKARNKSRLRPHQLRKYNLRSSVLDARANSHSWNDFLAFSKVWV